MFSVRLTVNDVGTMLGACAAGHGIAQVLALGTEDLLGRGKLVELFPDWSDERFPLYAFHLSRHVPRASAMIDLVQSSALRACKSWSRGNDFPPSPSAGGMRPACVCRPPQGLPALSTVSSCPLRSL